MMYDSLNIPNKHGLVLIVFINMQDYPLGILGQIQDCSLGRYFNQHSYIIKKYGFLFFVIETELCWSHNNCTTLQWITPGLYVASSLAIHLPLRNCIMFNCKLKSVRNIYVFHVGLWSVFYIQNKLTTSIQAQSNT